MRLILTILLFILLLGWPFFLEIALCAYYDFRVWYIQYRINRLANRRMFGGSVKDSIKFAKWIKKAEKLNIKINLTINSPGASIGSMQVKFIKSTNQCQSPAK